MGRAQPHTIDARHNAHWTPMTESDPRRRPTGDRCGYLRHLLEQADDALLAIVGLVANGQTPAAELERDRCRLVGERIASKGRRVVDLLARAPGVIAPVPAGRADGAILADMIARGRLTEDDLTPAGLRDLAEHRASAGDDAAFEAERDAILAEAADREQGEEP